VGIIDSISAGYRLLGRKVHLLLIPVALDLLIWLVPRLSIAPILARLADAYAAMADATPLPAEMAEMATSSTDMVRSLGDASNLLSGLVSGLVLHVPSLLSTGSLPTSAQAVDISSIGIALLVWAAIAAFGLWLGVLYLEMLARELPIGAPGKPTDWGELLRRSGRHWLRVLGFVIVVASLLLMMLIPMAGLITIATLIAPAVGTLLMPVMIAMVMVGFLFLYFVTTAIVLDDLPIIAAVTTSVRLVRTNFPSVLGFVILVTLIGTGISLLLARVAIYEPIGTLAAILLNAYIGTGLTMALLVFYRTRLLLASQPVTAG
jgi:hypothetical protein